MTEDIYEIRIRSITGKDLDLMQFRGRVLLLVNTASRCGFTPQYAGLEQLHREFGPRGLTVIGFPCNQFGGQEPGDAVEITRFCQTEYDVTFPLSEKIEVNGKDAHPLFRLLKRKAPGMLGTRGIKWNFTKFLVDRQGKRITRHAPTEAPECLRAEIERLLSE